MLDQQLSSIEGLEPSFAQRVQAMLAASNGRVSVVSGLRTTAQQQALWDKAKATYGENAADKWVAQPGQSNHETGNAVDLQGDLQLAHSLLPQFGLVAPMPWEAYHIEPSGMQTNSAAYTVPPPGYPDPTSPAAQTSTQSHLAALTQALAHLDPQDRAAVQASQPAPISGGGPAHLSPEDQAPSTPGTVAPAATNASPVAPPTAPAPVQPQAQSTASVIASPSVTGDTQKLLQGQPITDAAAPVSAPTSAQVNGAQGAAGVLGNPTGNGHIATTPQRVSFAQAVLAKAGLPDTPENERAMVAWQQGEGTSAAFNPLATTTHAPGSTAFNSNGGDPVQNFTTFEQGVDATVETLMNGHYANILAALAQGSSAIAVAQAIKASPWGTGGLVLKILEGG